MLISQLAVEGNNNQKILFEKPIVNRKIQNMAHASISRKAPQLNRSSAGSNPDFNKNLPSGKNFNLQFQQEGIMRRGTEREGLTPACLFPILTCNKTMNFFFGHSGVPTQARKLQIS